MFLNALKMIVGPVVFFSIACCISQFGDLKEAGRIGGKVMGFYLLTTVLAILTATGVFELLKPGNPELAAKLAGCSYGVGFGCKYFNQGDNCRNHSGKLCKTVFRFQHDAAHLFGSSDWNCIREDRGAFQIIKGYIRSMQ